MSIISEITSRTATLTRSILVTFFLIAISAPVSADDSRLDELFAELQQPDLQDWKSVEDKIWQEWSKSGSVAMDLLLSRGRDAMSAGEYDEAISHLTALVDHAPEFAEGWNARATAFFMMDEYGLSVSDIQHVLALNPRHFGAMAGLGMILEEIGNPKEALTVYTKALEVHPHQPQVIEAVERLRAAVEGTSL